MKKISDILTEMGVEEEELRFLGGAIRNGYSIEKLLEFVETKRTLDKRLRAALDYLEIPKYEKGPDSRPINPINKEHLWQSLDCFARIFEKTEQYLHSVRIGLYSIPVMDFLGINDKEWRKKFFTASLDHDEAKCDVFEIVDKKSGFTEEDSERMKLHVKYDLILSYFGKDVKAIIERHHFYRPNGYPKNPESKESPEIKILSQCLGVMDSHDAARNRKNTRTNLSIWDRLNRRKLPSPETVRKELIKEYGELKMDYNGNILPKTEMSGKEFINIMYNANIFGRENALNPFTEPDSFKFKRD